MDVVERNAAADRIAATFAATAPPSEEASRSEAEIMEDAIADIADSRRERRRRDGRGGWLSVPAAALISFMLLSLDHQDCTIASVRWCRPGMSLLTVPPTAGRPGRGRTSNAPGERGDVPGLGYRRMW